VKKNPPSGHTVFISQKQEDDEGMEQQDTRELLRECGAGVKMAVASMDEVLPQVRSQRLRNRLSRCRQDHEKLGAELKELLERRHDNGKDPNPLAQGMSWVKTNLKLAVDASDQTIADLMTDGCNMGVKSLRKYLNEYQAADETAKALANRLIALEEELAGDVSKYL